MRRNPPVLIDPVRDLNQRTDNALGLKTIDAIDRRLSALESLVSDIVRQRFDPADPIAIIGAVERLSRASPDVLTTINVKGSITATNVTSTSGTTITNGNIAPIAGLRYLIIGIAALALNAPAGQTIYSCMRIGASGTTVDGMRTATPSGERTCVAIDVQTITGDGSSINVAGRARVSGGTGTVNDAISIGIGIPLGAMVEV